MLVDGLFSIFGNILSERAHFDFCYWARTDKGTVIYFFLMFSYFLNWTIKDMLLVAVLGFFGNKQVSKKKEEW